MGHKGTFVLKRIFGNLFQTLLKRLVVSHLFPTLNVYVWGGGRDTFPSEADYQWRGWECAP